MPDDSRTPVQQAIAKVTEYISHASYNGKLPDGTPFMEVFNKITPLKSAAEVYIVAENSLGGKGMPEKVDKQVAAIVNKEDVNPNNAVAHAAFMINQTDKNTINGVDYKAGNGSYTAYLDKKDSAEVLAIRTAQVAKWGGDAVNDQDNINLAQKLTQQIILLAANGVNVGTSAGQSDASNSRHTLVSGSSTNSIDKDAVEKAKLFVNAFDKNHDGKISDSELGGATLPAGLTSTADDKDFNSAFDSKKTQLISGVKNDDPNESAELKELEKEKSAIAGTVSNITNEQNENPEIRNALQHEKEGVQKFGVALANATPQQKADVDRFFKQVDADPEGMKKWVAGAQAKDKQIENIKTDMANNTLASNGAGKIPNNLARAEQRDLNGQLKQELHKVEVADINSNSRPELVSSLNKTGDVQKQKDLDNFFAGVKAQDDAANANELKSMQSNNGATQKNAHDEAIASRLATPGAPGTNETANDKSASIAPATSRAASVASANPTAKAFNDRMTMGGPGSSAPRVDARIAEIQASGASEQVKNDAITQVNSGNTADAKSLVAWFNAADAPKPTSIAFSVTQSKPLGGAINMGSGAHAGMGMVQPPTFPPPDTGARRGGIRAI